MEEFDFNLSNDKEYVMKKVKEDGKTLDFASDALKNDKEVVMEAILQNPVSLEFASNNLKNDKEVVMASVKKVRVDSMLC